MAINNNAGVIFNIAETLNKDAKGKEILALIGRTVVEDYKTDLTSRSGLDKKQKTWFRLFAGQAEKKSFPWADSSNVIIPILSIACHQSHARAYDALVPPKEILKCISTDGATKNAAKRKEKYLNWQLTSQMTEWKPDMDKALLLNAINGTVVKKTYYDQLLRRVVSRTIRLDEFVAPYGVRDLDDAPRKTHAITNLTINDIKKRGVAGIWINTEDLSIENTPIITETPAQEYKDEADKVIGLTANTDSKDSRRLILEQHRYWNLDGNKDGIEQPYCITVDHATNKVLSINSLTYEDQEGERKTYNYFTAYNFIPNPDSWMGFGYGHILEHLNLSINAITNQLIDAGTLSNTIGGFVNKRRNLKIGNLKFKMGTWTEVDLPSDDIRKSLYQFQFKEPSSVLQSLLSMLQDYAQKVSSVSDSMLGELPPSDTAATSMIAVLEQSMKVQSTIHRRQHGSLRGEAEKISVLNAIYPDEENYRAVQDSTSEEAQEEFSSAEDFSLSIDTIPVSDPTITSRAEKLIRSDRSYDILKADAEPMELYWLRYKILDAMGEQDIDKILKKPEPPSEPPDLRPEEEEASFLREVGVLPLETQDHEYHLDSHNVFKENMSSQPKDSLIELSPQGKKLLESHIKETQALYYLQLEREQDARDQEAFQLGNAGMDTEPVYTGIPTGA